MRSLSFTSLRERHGIRGFLPLGRVLLPVLLLFSAATLRAIPSQSSSPMLKRHAAQILALIPEQADLESLVELRGVAILSSDSGLVVHDATGGIWVNLPSKLAFAQGDLLIVRGKVGLGRFSPVVNATSVQKIGTAQLPPPLPVTFRELSSGSMDAQYVTVTGIVRAVELSPDVADPRRKLLKLAMQGGFVDVSISTAADASLDQLLDAEVQVDAVALSAKNLSRQLTAVVLGANGLDSIHVLTKSAILPFEAPPISLGRVMQYRSGTDYYHRVHVVGSVTYYEAGKRLILEDAGQAILVTTTERPKLNFGDRVEASGFVASEASGPILQDATIRLKSRGIPIEPTRARVEDLLSGALRYRLITIEGKLVRRIDERSGTVFLVQDNASLLQAELQGPQWHNASAAFTDGAQVRVTGISLVDVEGKWAYVASVVRCKILMRSADDIQVISPPSWWDTRRITYLAVIFGLLILLLLALMTHSLISRWKLQLVMQERERMAHEIHDTMAQSFAGVGFQLQAILRAVPEDLLQLRREVTLARELVRHSHREARRSFLPPQEVSQEPIDLPSEIKKCALSMIVSDKVAIIATVSGAPIPIAPSTANELLHIGQEAIANAMRHADPTELKLTVQFHKDEVQIEVEDNGVGFVNSGDLIGFGLRGMRKRAASIGGRLEIHSRPGKGTRIIANAPARDAGHLLLLMHAIWRRFLRSFAFNSAGNIS